MFCRSTHSTDLFEPEVILPSQFFGAARAASERPEKRLMLAVLQDAVATLLKHSGSNRPAGRRMVREVQQWITAREARWPFSFENICSALGFDAGAIREGLQRITEGRASEASRVVSFAVVRHVAGKRHRVAMPRVHHRALAAGGD